MTEGIKHDQDKPRYDLIDSGALDELAKVLTFGAKKYAAHNWRGGISYSRLIAALLRHVYSFLRGENLDEETGLSHIAHAMCCCMFLIWMTKHRKDLDDRYKYEKTDCENSKESVKSCFTGNEYRELMKRYAVQRKTQCCGVPHTDTGTDS